MKTKSLLKTLSCVMFFMLAILTVACTPDKPTPTPKPEPEIDLSELYDCITIEEAIQIALEAGEVGTSEQYFICGTVKSVSNPTYGEMIVKDKTGELYIYGSMSDDGVFYDKMEEKPVKGDQIVLYGMLKTYDGEPQMGAKDSKALIIDFYHSEVEVDLNVYKESTIKEARDAESGDKVKVDGVVASILYADGRVPSGFILVDETSSIHVHNGDIAAQVSVGNKIEIAASKTYWVLSSELANAKLYGYKGACQLEDPILISNDKGNHEFDKSWIQETTVKGILDTPVSENITTMLYKVTAVINKAEGKGFVNYYINDLDGQTGTYTYTQCSGSDFAWLDEFDGKICNVYVMALNAKSSSSGCIFRFLPVQVEEIKDYVFDMDKAAQFALDYAVDGLIGEVYGANPRIKLPTSYTNLLLGIENVEILYTSSNTSVATITTEGSEAVLNLLEAGTAEITVTAKANGKEATAKYTIKLDPSSQITTPSIAETIAVEDGTLVQVRGVVMSSLVNREGFYLGDETGMIGVLADQATMSQIKPGDEIVIEGYKVHHRKLNSGTYTGQCAIVGSIEYYVDDDGNDAVSYKNNITLLANYYGEKAYSTSYFDKTKKLSDLVNTDVNEDLTTNVYVIQAKVKYVETAFYTTLSLLDPADETISLGLYCSGASQYSWLIPYDGQTITIEIALCNWNDKNSYKGCVIAVITEDGKVVNNLNWENK